MENKQSPSIGIIILAAGGSARLGRAKQLLPYKNETLLQYTVQTALASSAQPVVVVLGAEAEAMQNEINESVVHTIVNTEWREGMASSIRCGLKNITAIAPAIEGILLMVCDQPFVSASLLEDLISAHQKTGIPIVASSYEDTFGPPVFFHHSLFDELLQLKGDIGARSIVRQHTNLVETIPFPDGTFDVDTEADFERLKATTSDDKGQL